MAEHAAGGDVLEHRQRRQHADDLEGAGDPHAGDDLGRRSRDLLAVEMNAARIELERAGDQVHHRGLARAVGADQAQHLVLDQIERQRIDGHEPAEGLGDIADGQREIGGHGATRLPA
jgi:hypothetical protein